MWTAALIFVLTVMAGLLVAAVAGISIMRGNRPLALRLATVLGVAVMLYLSALVAVALTSDRQVLALGAEKRICELDCHLAYAVESVVKRDTLGSTTAAGTFYVVTLRIRFDGSSVTPRRPADAALRPGDRIVRVIDGAGRRYEPNSAAQLALGAPQPGPEMLTRELKPGEEFRVQLAFDLPKDVRDPMLLIQDADVTKWVLIGSETFPLHQKSLLRLTS